MSTQAKHTPGPWAIKGSYNKGFIVGSSQGSENVALVLYTEDGKGLVNASLIAAAPELEERLRLNRVDADRNSRDRERVGRLQGLLTGLSIAVAAVAFTLLVH